DRALGRADRARVSLFFALISAYELWGLQTLERLIKKDEEPPAFRRYLNAFVETSIPTLEIFYYAATLPPAEALLMLPAFIYFVFILLSTLRLDFSLCVFTGAVAAIEYGCIAIVVIGDGHVMGADAALTSVAHHLSKAAILFVSGVAAGFVAQRL